MAAPTSEACAASSSPRCTQSVPSSVAPRNVAVPALTPTAVRRFDADWPKNQPTSQKPTVRTAPIASGTTALAASDPNPSAVPAASQCVATGSGRSSRHENATAALAARTARGSTRPRSVVDRRWGRGSGGGFRSGWWSSQCLLEQGEGGLGGRESARLSRTTASIAARRSV